MFPVRSIVPNSTHPVQFPEATSEFSPALNWDHSQVNWECSQFNIPNSPPRSNFPIQFQFELRTFPIQLGMFPIPHSQFTFQEYLPNAVPI